ncbi:hypothetical protein V8C35DRAFT_246185 [Trichoderma chlorosporum]
MNRKHCLSDSSLGVPGPHAGSDGSRRGETPAMGAEMRSSHEPPNTAPPRSLLRKRVALREFCRWSR